MNEDYRKQLSTAAETYREQEVIANPFPLNAKHYDLLLEKAFMEGATWYNGVLLERKQTELAAVKAELEEVRAHARP